MLRGKRERRDDPYYCAIDVTAFAGIMVVLVMIMEVPLIYVHSRNAVDLPSVSSPKLQYRALREDAIKIAITHDGKLFFSSDQLFADALHERISRAVAAGSDPKVYISADARAQYGLVKEVVREAQMAGIEKIVFIANAKNSSTPTR